MVQGVTPAHKGLAPSRLIFYLSVKQKMPILGLNTIDLKNFSKKQNSNPKMVNLF